MVEYTDESIVTELRNGSQTQFCYLYDKYYSDLNRFSFHIVMCEDSHDIVHDVFVKLWKEHSKLPVELNIKSYLYTAVKNSSFNYLKHRNVVDSRREQIIESMLFQSDEWKEEKESLLEIMNSRILELPKQQKKIIEMKGDGMSHLEIASKLNISTKTVNNQVFNAYKFIRKNSLIIFFIFFR